MIRHAISRIEASEAKVESLMQRHANWHPADLQLMKAWKKKLANMKRRVEFAEHPTIKEMVAYKTGAVAEINHALMNEKELSLEERRILMEKRDMYKKDLRILVVPDSTIIAMEEAVAFEMGERTTVDKGAFQGRPYSPKI